MNKKPFHPTPVWYDEQELGIEEGITKREYMALKIFCCLLRDCPLLQQTEEDFNALSLGLIKDSIDLTDMLIKELNK